MWTSPLSQNPPSLGRPAPRGNRALRPPSAPAFAETALDAPLNFDHVFRVVRSTVRGVLGRERPGLGLALSDLPASLGAYWPVTGNLIVMNESLVDAMRAHARSPREFNSFVYVILAHEYPARARLPLGVAGPTSHGAGRPGPPSVPSTRRRAWQRGTSGRCTRSSAPLRMVGARAFGSSPDSTSQRRTPTSGRPRPPTPPLQDAGPPRAVYRANDSAATAMPRDTGRPRARTLTARRVWERVIQGAVGQVTAMSPFVSRGGGRFGR